MSIGPVVVRESFHRYHFLNQQQQFFYIFSRYKYETSVSHSTSINNTDSILPCLSNHSLAEADKMPDLEAMTGNKKNTNMRYQIHSFIGAEERVVNIISSFLSQSVFHLQLVKKQLARLCGSMYSWETCSEALEKLPSCLWVYPTSMTSPERRTLLSI